MTASISSLPSANNTRAFITGKSLINRGTLETKHNNLSKMHRLLELSKDIDGELYESVNGNLG